MNHEFGPVSPNHDYDLKEPGTPIRSQVQDLVQVVTVVSHKEGVHNGVADVVIFESVTGLMLPC